MYSQSLSTVKKRLFRDLSCYWLVIWGIMSLVHPRDQEHGAERHQVSRTKNLPQACSPHTKESATPGMEYVSFSFSIFSLLTWEPIFSELFPKQPQQLNCFRFGPCSSTNKLCPLMVEPLFLLGNFSNIRQRLLHFKTWGTAPPLEWAIRYIPIPQSQLVLPSKRVTNPERRQSKEVG